VHDVSDIVIDKLHLMTARVSYPRLLGLELWLAPTLFSPINNDGVWHAVVCAIYDVCCASNPDLMPFIFKII
jgi:hypothetical protein